MRLNWYLPQPRGGGKPDPAVADRVRRALKWVGATWAASPVRRVVQVAALLLFLWLFFHVCWPYGSQEGYAGGLASRERVPAETFLLLDPLVGFSSSIAARAWVGALAWAAGMLVVCLLIPRGFCGYLCPFGTIIDGFDWLIGRRVSVLRVSRDGWWVNLKYYLLLGTLLASTMGVLVAGFVAAIPVVTRGVLFVLAPLQLGSMKGWYLVPPMNAGHYLSLALFGAVLGLGLLRKRFWCRYVCPTGAIFSIGNLLRLTQRKVLSNCIGCGKCEQVCPFDAINGDYSTRPLDCTLCQTCGGACPVGAIQFVSRWDTRDVKDEDASAGVRVPVSRRGFLIGAACGAGAAIGVGLPSRIASGEAVVRPPGSVPETQFLQLCIRCGECFKVCPNNVLQPMGLSDGWANLWTPRVVADWSGCEPSCNNCGQVCPTGAIRALPLDEKRAARMGLAVVDEGACLPYAGREACQMCFDECTAAGYNAIEFRRVGVRLGEDGLPVEDSGFLAPVVLAVACVGCGLCQTRCHGINVKRKKLLRGSAVVVLAGEGREDRLAEGSYLELTGPREQAQQLPIGGGGADNGYLPDFLQ